MTYHSLIDNRARLHGSARGPNSGPFTRTRLQLLPSNDGWSLVGTDGELVFSAIGVSGRRRCLEFAQAGGVIALTG